MPASEHMRSPAIVKHKYASSESSASPRDLSPMVSGAGPIVTIPASPTTDQNISDAALSSPDNAMQGSDLAGDLEQPDYPTRPMTPGEEEIKRSIPTSGYNLETRRFLEKEIL